MQPIETTTLRLRDGRALEVAELGRAGGPLVLFFHGFIGSHHQAAFAHEAALRAGLRLVAVNRPGVGRSSPAPRRRSVAQCVPDVEDLAVALGAERFAVLGVSGGAPYALACQARLARRVAVTALVSGLGPVAERSALGLMPWHARRALQMGRHAPLLARWFLGLARRRHRRDPEGFLSGLIRRWSLSDQRLFQRRELRELFLADLAQVLIHGQGPAGLAQELGLYSRWGFGLGEVPAGARVLIWHGTEDRLVPPGMSQAVAGHLPGGAEVMLRPGGHFMAVQHAEEIVARVREAM